MYYKKVSNHPQLNALLMEGILEEVPAIEVETPIKRRVRIVFPYDLRTDQVIKSLDCIKGNDWTAFINKKQTLCHVMRHGQPSLLIRLPKLSMQNMSKRSMSRFIADLLYEAL